MSEDVGTWKALGSQLPPLPPHLQAMADAPRTERLSCGCPEYGPQGFTPPHRCCSCQDAGWVRRRLIPGMAPAHDQIVPCGCMR